MGKRTFGSVRKLPSGRFQARYTGPDGATYTGRSEGGKALTFDARQYADAYLSRVSADIQAGRWAPPDYAPVPARNLPPTLAAYSAAWMAGRDLSPSTRLHYGFALRHILPALGGTLLPDLTPVMVREWHGRLKGSTGPTMRAKAYSLLRTILNTALADDIISSNPCRVRGAGNVKRARRIEPATLAELEAIVTAMPARLRLMVLLAAWCQLRFGELAGLRRADIDTKNGLVHHTGATLAAVSGATLAELMARLGHSTVGAAMRYQHAAADRDKVIAAALSGLAAGTVTPIGKAKTARRRRQAV